MLAHFTPATKATPSIKDRAFGSRLLLILCALLFSRRTCTPSLKQKLKPLGSRWAVRVGGKRPEGSLETHWNDSSSNPSSIANELSCLRKRQPFSEPQFLYLQNAGFNPKDITSPHSRIRWEMRRETTPDSPHRPPPPAQEAWDERTPVSDAPAIASMTRPHPKNGGGAVKEKQVELGRSYLCFLRGRPSALENSPRNRAPGERENNDGRS